MSEEEQIALRIEVALLRDSNRKLATHAALLFGGVSDLRRKVRALKHPLPGISSIGYVKTLERNRLVDEILRLIPEIEDSLRGRGKA